MRLETDLIPNFCAESEPIARRKATSQKRAGLGVWASTRSVFDRSEMVKEKEMGIGLVNDGFAYDIAELIKEWAPYLDSSIIVTSPPQGASAPGRYYAEDLAIRVAEKLDLTYVTLIERTDTKKRHGPWESRLQADYSLHRNFYVPHDPYRFIIIVDDLITSGTTMRLALKAIRDQGCMAFGFSYSGC